MKANPLIFLFCMLALVATPAPFSPSDPTFAAQQQQSAPASSYDSDFLALMVRVGGESASMTNYLNTFFTSLKASNVFTKLQGLNAFCFANSGSNGQPFITGQPLIKWNGTFTANDSTGITGNGSSGYADMQVRTSTNQDAGTYYVYCKTDGGTTAHLCGALGSGTEAKIRHNGSAAWAANYNANANVSLAGGSFPGSVMMTRSTSTNMAVYYASASQGSTVASTTPPAFNVYLCGVNNQGSALANWAGQIQGWAFSTNTLTADDKTALDTAFAALRTSMGN